MTRSQINTFVKILLALVLCAMVTTLYINITTAAQAPATAKFTQRAISVPLTYDVSPRKTTHSSVYEMKCPKGFAYFMGQMQQLHRQYFECDFTSGTCERGYADSMGMRVFELLAPDRATVIGHFMLQSRVVHNFDKGTKTILTNNGTYPMESTICSPNAS